MRWSEAVTLQFVKIYLKHECLWNPSDPGYKIRFQREKAYSEIGSEFKSTTKKSLTNSEVKLKIKILRTTYVQQVQKILQKSSPDCIYEPSLVWFKEMDRCLKHVPTHRHSSSFNSSQEAEMDSSCKIWVEQEIQNTNTDAINPNLQYEEYHQTKPNEEPEQLLKVERQPSPVYKKSKKKNLKHYVPKNRYSIDMNVSKEDEFDCYGKFIASQMRAMELHKALRLQLKIQNLIREARISDAE